MTRARAISALFRAAAFSLWAAALAVVGLWILVTGPRDVILARPLLLSLGLAALAAGHILFMTMVADRLFPKASRRLRGPIELTALSVFLGSTAGFLWTYVSGL